MVVHRGSWTHACTISETGAHPLLLQQDVTPRNSITMTRPLSTMTRILCIGHCRAFDGPLLIVTCILYFKSSVHLSAAILWTDDYVDVRSPMFTTTSVRHQWRAPTSTANPTISYATVYGEYRCLVTGWSCTTMHCVYLYTLSLSYREPMSPCLVHSDSGFAFL